MIPQESFDLAYDHAAILRRAFQDTARGAVL